MNRIGLKIMIRTHALPNRALIVVAAFLLLSLPNTSKAQTQANNGYKGNIELGRMFQYPEAPTYTSISTSHGIENGKGLYYGGGVIFEYSRQIIDDDREYGPYSGRQPMAGIFLNAKYDFTKNDFKPFVDAKIGQLYNIKSREAKNFFVRPSLGVSYKMIAISGGVDIGWGHYEYYCQEGDVIGYFEDWPVYDSSPTRKYGPLWSFIPYAGLSLCF